MPLDLKIGTVIFASPQSDKKSEEKKDIENAEILAKAKQYISQNNLTVEDVKLVVRKGCLLVVTKREFAL